MSELSKIIQLNRLEVLFVGRKCQKLAPNDTFHPTDPVILKVSKLSFHKLQRFTGARRARPSVCSGNLFWTRVQQLD